MIGRLNSASCSADQASLVRQRLPYSALRLAAVPQVTGPDHIYFAEMSRRGRGKKRTLLIYELVRKDDGTVSRRRAGRMTTVDEEALYAAAQSAGEAITARSGLPDKAKFPVY